MPPPEPLSPGEPSDTKSPISILVIDDDDTVSAAIIRILRSDGYTAMRASNGREGVEMFRVGKPDLVITDLVMPEMEGLETILALRRINPKSRIIAMSGGGRGDPETYLDMASKLGATDTLEKPFTRERLLAAVVAASSR